MSFIYFSSFSKQSIKITVALRNENFLQDSWRSRLSIPSFCWNLSNNLKRKQYRWRSIRSSNSPSNAYFNDWRVTQQGSRKLLMKKTNDRRWFITMISSIVEFLNTFFSCLKIFEFENLQFQMRRFLKFYFSFSI